MNPFLLELQTGQPTTGQPAFKWQGHSFPYLITKRQTRKNHFLEAIRER